MSSRPNRRGSQAVLAVLSVGMLLAAACGDDDDTTAEPDATAAEPGATSVESPAPAGSTSADTSTAPPESSGDDADPDAVLVYGTDLSSTGGAYLDPIANVSGHQASRMWMDAICDTMVREGPDGEPKPGLATEWNLPDDSTIELTLREGVLFQDGTPFNADAVKFAWDRLIANMPANAPSAVRALESVDVLGEHSVRVNLSAPVAGSMIREWFFRGNFFCIVSPTAVEKYGAEYSQHPVGAGPYAFVEYVPDQKIVLERWDGHWDPDTQKLAGIEFVQLQTGSPMVSALSAGTIDMGQLRPDDVPAIEGQPSLEVANQASSASLLLASCASKPPFDNVEARQALAYAIDRDAINTGAYGGTGQPTDVMLPPTSPYAVPDLAGRYSYDPDKARELLQNAGVAEGTSIRVLVPAQIPTTVRAGEIVQAQLGEVGLDVELIQAQDAPRELNEGQPEIFLAEILAISQENVLLPEAQVNWCGYNNPEYVGALEATKSSDEETVAQGWRNVQQVMLDDLPMAYALFVPVLEGHSAEVQGITVLHTQNQGPLMRTLYKTG